METNKTSGRVNPNIWIRQPEEKTKVKGIAGTTLGSETDATPKYKTFDVLTLRISNEDLEFLHRLERDIMRNRSKERKKERITKNTIVRAMIGCLKNVKLDKENISDENELRERIMKGLKDHPSWLF